MFISVLICTRNRAEDLTNALNSLFSEANLQQSDWDVVVVDNGSTDATPQVCQRFQSLYPNNFRSMVEPKAGKSNALNTGFTAIRGDLIAMTDDDVLCAPDFISAIRSTFAQNSADGAQGRVVLDFEGGRPSWLNEESAALLSQRDYGDAIIEWPDNLSGCNMIIRRAVIAKTGGFSPQVGAGAAGFMEDSEFSARVRAAGHQFIYAPAIKVRHQIHRSQLTKPVFVNRYFRWGRSQAYLVPLRVPLWRFGAFSLKQYLFGHAKALGLILSGNSDRAFGVRCAAVRTLGIFYQHYRFAMGWEASLPPPAIPQS